MSSAVQVGAGGWTDQYGIANSVASNTFVWNYDGIHPTFTSFTATQPDGTSLTSPATTNDSYINLRFVISEAVTGFTVGDINVTGSSNYSITNFNAVSSSIYDCSFSRTADDTFTIQVPQDSFTDIAGNLNNLASSQFVWTSDTTAPVFSGSPTINANNTEVSVTFENWYTTTKEPQQAHPQPFHQAILILV